ncbi:MAG: GH3 auxin-responsive promoter family protein, partial [Bacteroidota bacterium]
MTVGGSLVRRGLMLVNRLERDRDVPASVQQERVLKALLKQAKHTSFGQAYQFDRLLSQHNPIAAFQDTVAVHSYGQLFDQWWKRALEGEANVTWPGQVKYFALSSGTSGATTKYIPVTTAMQRAMGINALRMFACLPKYNVASEIYFKEWMMVGGSAQLQNLGHCYAGDLSGINASRPPAWIKRFYRPGTALAQIADWDERLDTIAKNAWKWDVGIMTGVPSWVQLTLERIMEFYGLDSIHDLWPNLSVYVSGGIAFEPYRKSLEALF